MDAKKKASRFYVTFFSAVCVLFIGLLLFTYRLTRRATIVMLDEHGHATGQH